MITSKQRATLRSMANGIEPIFQVGKGGITETMISQLENAIKARELIKISVLETCEYTAREVSEQLTKALRAEPVQCIGRKVTIYRESREKKKIEI